MVKSYFKYRNIGIVPIVALIYSSNIIMYGLELLNNSVVRIQNMLVTQLDGSTIMMLAVMVLSVMMLIVTIGVFGLLMWYIVQFVEGIFILAFGSCEPEELLNVIFGGMFVQMAKKGKRYFSERKRL